MEKLKHIIYNKNAMLILSFLTKNKGQETISSHIAKEIGISVGSTHQILKQFEAEGIVKCRKIGKSAIYEISNRNPMIKAFRQFENLVELDNLFENLKEHSRKIILFGSCGRGEDTQRSDIDLFIVADDDEHNVIKSLIDKYVIDRQIKPIIADMGEFINMELTDKAFYLEVLKGTEVWEVSDGKYR